MRFTAGCLTIALGLVSACGAPAPEPPALESHLACAGSLTVSMVVDHDAGVRDTRPPEEQARQYGAAVGGSFSGKRKVVYRSRERIDISFVDGEGRIQAVLSFRNHGWGGWRLEGAVNCP
jgi:hypothetical protein